MFACYICFIQCRWVEEDPKEILESVKTCINVAVENLKELDIDPKQIKGAWCE